MKMFRAISVACVLASIGACSSSTTESSSPSIAALRVEVAPGSKVFVFDSVGTRTNLEVHTIDSGGIATIPASPVTFTSRNGAVAMVDANGQVTTLSKGSTWVIGSLFVNGQQFKDSVQVVYGVSGF